MTGEQEARARAKEEGGAGGVGARARRVCARVYTCVCVSSWEGGMVGCLPARGRTCGPHPEVRNQCLV